MFFLRKLGKKELNYIFNDEQWSIKHDQGQRTYIVLLDQPGNLLGLEKGEIGPRKSLIHVRCRDA